MVPIKNVMFLRYSQEILSPPGLMLKDWNRCQNQRQKFRSWRIVCNLVGLLNNLWGKQIPTLSNTVEAWVQKMMLLVWQRSMSTGFVHKRVESHGKLEHSLSHRHFHSFLLKATLGDQEPGQTQGTYTRMWQMASQTKDPICGFVLDLLLLCRLWKLYNETLQFKPSYEHITI